MILKIKDGTRWIYIDKISVIHAERVMSSMSKIHKATGGSYYGPYRENKEEQFKVLDAVIITDDKLGKSIFTEGEAYLLNDEGKTIERL